MTRYVGEDTLKDRHFLHNLGRRGGVAQKGQLLEVLNKIGFGEEVG
jgi:hypothetical protein